MTLYNLISNFFLSTKALKFFYDTKFVKKFKSRRKCPARRRLDLSPLSRLTTAISRLHFLYAVSIPA